MRPANGEKTKITAAKIAKMKREPERDVGSESERVEMLAPWTNDQLANSHAGNVTTGVRTF